MERVVRAAARRARAAPGRGGLRARARGTPLGTYERQTGGRVFATALAVLMLEPPYRHRRLARRPPPPVAARRARAAGASSGAGRRAAASRPASVTSSPCGSTGASARVKPWRSSTSFTIARPSPPPPGRRVRPAWPAERALRHVRQLLRRDPGAVVEHAQAKPVAGVPDVSSTTAACASAYETALWTALLTACSSSVTSPSDLHALLGHGVLERHAAAARDGRVPVHGAAEHAGEVHAVPVEVDLAGLEPRERPEVVEQHPDVVRLLERAPHPLAVGGAALGGLVAQRREVRLQHRQRRADVVRRVADEVAQGALAGLDGGDVRADRLARAVERARDRRDLVVAGDDGLRGARGRLGAADVLLEPSQAPHDRARGQPHRAEHAEREREPADPQRRELARVVRAQARARAPRRTGRRADASAARPGGRSRSPTLPVGGGRARAAPRARREARGEGRRARRCARRSVAS